MSATATAGADAPLQYKNPVTSSAFGQGPADIKQYNVRLTSLSVQGDIHPVEPGATAGMDLQRVRQQWHQFLVKVAHLAALVPETPQDGVEVAPFLAPEALEEGLSFALLGGGGDHVELLVELLHRVRVVVGDVAQGEDLEFRHFVAGQL